MSAITSDTLGRVTSDDKQLIKCVVWDLDNTLWHGTLAEDRAVRPRLEALETVRILDGRGILQSIASRNDPDAALRVLGQQGVRPYFLEPQISWNAKSASVRQIAARLNIAPAHMAFIDDDVVERAEVAHALPDVLCLGADLAGELPGLPRFRPRRLTPEAMRRRELYLAESARQEAEAAFVGPSEEFLASLGMVVTIAPLATEDLARAEELTIRTNQLNTSGLTYSAEELDAFRHSPRHTVLVASLTDRFGDYGKIGLALVERDPALWTIKLMLMSCRVMSRGVGTAMLHVVLAAGRARQVSVRAEFVPTPFNRMMNVFYRSMGFRQIGGDARCQILEADRSRIPALPSSLRVDATLD